MDIVDTFSLTLTFLDTLTLPFPHLQHPALALPSAPNARRQVFSTSSHPCAHISVTAPALSPIPRRRTRLHFFSAGAWFWVAYLLWVATRCSGVAALHSTTTRPLSLRLQVLSHQLPFDLSETPPLPVTQVPAPHLLSTLKGFLLRQIGVGPPHAWHSKPKSPLRLCSGFSSLKTPPVLGALCPIPITISTVPRRHLIQLTELRRHLGTRVPLMRVPRVRRPVYLRLYSEVFTSC